MSSADWNDLEDRFLREMRIASNGGPDFLSEMLDEFVKACRDLADEEISQRCKALGIRVSKQLQS